MENMINEATDELHQDLDLVAKKHHLERGVILLEYTEPSTQKKKSRVILFDIAPLDKTQINLHGFALVYENCLKISDTFQQIVSHMANHFMNKLITDAVVDQKMKTGGTHAD